MMDLSKGDIADVQHDGTCDLLAFAALGALTAR